MPLFRGDLLCNVSVCTVKLVITAGGNKQILLDLPVHKNRLPLAATLRTQPLMFAALVGT